VSLSTYRRVLAFRDARRAIVLGLLVRVPMMASGVVLTLHVVQGLGRSYAQAGLVSAAATAAVAISAPWRGRLLDRIGLRRVVAPSVLVNLICWSVAPWLGYVPLLIAAAVGGLFVVPIFSIIRLAVTAAVTPDDRRSALSLDAVTAEVSFMVGPVLGIWIATAFSTSVALFSIEMAAVLAGGLIWLVNPSLTDDIPEAAEHLPRSMWVSPPFIAVCVAACATTLILSGTDIAIVAALRDFDAVASIGPIMALWGFGSIVGGLVYGAKKKAIPATVMLGGLALVTAPAALAAGPVSIGALVILAGLLCAPTITATVDEVSRLVPESARGEAIGWHASAMTAGSTLGAPLAGAAIDRWGFGGGFVAVSLAGLAVSVAGFVVMTSLRPAEPAFAPAPLGDSATRATHATHAAQSVQAAPNQGV